MMRQLADEIWVVDQSLRFLGLEIGARMTVVRLPGRKLLLHSPIAVSNELVRAVEALGSVAYLVAPNRFHHLFAGAWQEICPAAALYVAPGLETKRPELRVAGVLGDTPEPGWADVLDQAFVRGFPLANEVVFFHKSSSTLVISDLAFHIGPTSPAATRLAFRLGGAYARLSPTILERFLVRDRAAFRSSLARILEWPFDRVVMAHGEVLERGGREQLARGYAWLWPRSERPA